MSRFSGLRFLGCSFQPSARAACQAPLELSSTCTRQLRSICGPARHNYARPRQPLRFHEAEGLPQWHFVCRPARARPLFTDAVIRNYVELPPNYTDAAGLPFRRRDLDQREVLAIFGPGIAAAAANKLLRVLHGRRVAGTLDDPQLRRAPVVAAFSAAQKKIALEYLRRTVPVDEVINAGLCAEDELRALEAAEQEAADNAARGPGEAVGAIPKTPRFTLYRDEDGEAISPPENVYGEGVIDRIRAANRAKREKQEREEEEEFQRREEEEQKRLEEEGAKQIPGELQVVADEAPQALANNEAPRELSPQMQKWSEAATSDLEEPPEMSKLRRLAPAAAFVALAVGAMVLYADYYEAPDILDRLLPNYSPAVVTVASLIGANVLVWMAWKAPPLWRLLNRYFLFVPATPRPLAMLGAVFSHQKLTHLISNMLFAAFFGVRLHEEVGRGDFMAVYVTSGLVGFMGTFVSIVLRNRLDLTTLGASGALYGMTAAYFWLHRFEGFKIFGLPPDPFNGIQGLGFIAFLAGLNVLALFSKSHALDVTSHLVGLAWGVASGMVLERRRRDRKAVEDQESRPADLAIIVPTTQAK